MPHSEGRRTREGRGCGTGDRTLSAGLRSCRRRSAIKSHGLSVREALIQEWYNGREALIEDGVAGAAPFSGGLGPDGGVWLDKETVERWWVLKRGFSRGGNQPESRGSVGDATTD